MEHSINEYIWFVKNNDWMRKSMCAVDSLWDCGWGNGYVVLPPSHPCYGENYGVISNRPEMEGWPQELTFGQWVENWPECPEKSYVIGFDTMHWGQSMASWPKERCEEVTKDLMERMVKIWWNARKI